MKKLLVPTDFSEQAMAATDLACEIGKMADAKVTLLYVVEIPHSSSFTTTGPGLPTSNPSDNVFVMQMINQAKDRLDELVNDNRFEGVDLHYHIMIGSPFAHIQQIIEEEGIDLVVMGTKGATGLEEVLIGSNTEKVVRRSKAPVLAVKQAVKLADLKKIVLASSLHDGEIKLVNALKDFAALVGAQLVLVRINTPNNFQSDRVTSSQMDAFAQKCDIDSVEKHSYSDAIEEDGIRHFAESIQADMIAMATHGRTGFIHLLSGSIAEDVVNHANRPVWTYNIG